MIASLQGFVGENISLLAPVADAWQPTDCLPDLTGEDWAEQLARFRESALHVSDDLLVVLVGNMVTEEALPNYSISLEHIVKDPTGITDTRGRTGYGGGPPRRIATATCSTPTCASQGGST